MRHSPAPHCQHVHGGRAFGKVHILLGGCGSGPMQRRLNTEGSEQKSGLNRCFTAACMAKTNRSQPALSSVETNWSLGVTGRTLSPLSLVWQPASQRLLTWDWAGARQADMQLPRCTSLIWPPPERCSDLIVPPVLRALRHTWQPEAIMTGVVMPKCRLARREDNTRSLHCLWILHADFLSSHHYSKAHAACSSFRSLYHPKKETTIWV